MFTFSNLKSEQIRQTVDTEHVYEAWLDVSDALRHRFSGSMTWKTVAGKSYLYRKITNAWKSIGPRTIETEHSYAQFRAGRQEARERRSILTARLDEMAAINRAMRLGRMPKTTARILRALGKANLVGSALDVVGTNAIYAYERMSGVRIESGLLATGDIDLLFDSRTSLSLLRRNIGPDGLIGILRTADASFQPLAKDSFRASNNEGYLVDLIGPPAANPLLGSKRLKLSDQDNDLSAVEIEGLQWMINSPKVMAIVLDERGYPVRYTVPDPRSFSLHKLWLSRRPDRDPLKRQRDEAQAHAVATMVRQYMPHLRFDDAALGAIPKSLRKLSAELLDTGGPKYPAETPDW